MVSLFNENTFKCIFNYQAFSLHYQHSTFQLIKALKVIKNVISILKVKSLCFKYVFLIIFYNAQLHRYRKSNNIIKLFLIVNMYKEQK